MNRGWLKWIRFIGLGLAFVRNAVSMRIKGIDILLLILGLFICAVALRGQPEGTVVAAVQKAVGKKTIGDRLAEFGPAARKRLVRDFERIGVAYPPKKVILVGLKHEKRLEVWVSDPPRFLKSYPIKGASGTLGPKLREGDMQVPEGLYRIGFLNANSLYHLALRVNYPNQFDKTKAKQDGRTNLGGDIMIHGKNCSIGCLAMGDEAAEELFVLAAETGIRNISLILSPVDFRKCKLPERMVSYPPWTTELYDSIKRELRKLEKRS